MKGPRKNSRSLSFFIEFSRQIELGDLESDFYPFPPSPGISFACGFGDGEMFGVVGG